MPLLSLTAFLEPEVRVECWVRTSVPTHPKGCCCGVDKGTTSPHTPQGMLLWGLQRYYLSPHTPRDAAVGSTEVLPLPPHPKGCCCGVYRGTTSPHTPQGMLLWGLQRYYLSPHTPRDAAVGFTKVLPLPTPHTPRDAAVGFTKVLPLPTPTPQGIVLWGLQRYYLSPPPTPQGMVLWGLQRYYLSPHTPRDGAVGFTKVLPLPTPHGMVLWGLQRYYLSPHTPRDAAVGLTEVLPLTPLPLPHTHPKGCCCGVDKGTTSPHTPQGMLLWGLQRYSLSPHTPRDAAVGFTKVLPLPSPPPPPLHPKGCCCGVYKGTPSPHTPYSPCSLSNYTVMWSLSSITTISTQSGTVKCHVKHNFLFINTTIII